MPGAGGVMLYGLLAAPFTEFEFMRRALTGVLALALGAGPIGVFLMLRRVSLVGDAMAHAILPGAAVGFLLSGLNLFAMTAGGLIAGLLVAVLTGLVTRAPHLTQRGPCHHHPARARSDLPPAGDGMRRSRIHARSQSGGWTCPSRLSRAGGD